MIRLIRAKLAKEDIGSTNILLIVLTAIVLLAALFGNKGCIDYSQLGDQKARLEQDIIELGNRKAFMHEKLTALSTGDWLLENIAREKLGMIKKDEKVFQIEFQDED